MPLTVLSVAYTFAPVGRRAVGGAEQILTTLDRGIAAHGDLSVVVACEGSDATGPLYSYALPATESIRDADRTWARKRLQAAIDQACAQHPIDLVHLHGLDFADYLVPRGIPALATLHLPIAWYGAALETTTAQHTHLCCVSQTQRRSFPPELGNPSVVENGVTIPETPVNLNPEDFALVLGRICPEKNAHEALLAGTRSRTPVLLAGQVFPYPEHQLYFSARLEPLLHASSAPARHTFVGPVDAAERSDLLARAKCLLHPTLAPETSSLVAMEALAAGTPVIAYRSGALPEIVTDGVTGFLVDSVEEMAEAIGKVHLISRLACREYARRRFNQTRMVAAYRALYAELTASCSPGQRYA